MTRQEYLAAGDEICEKVNRRVESLGNPQTFEDRIGALAEKGPDLVSTARDAARDFQELRPPRALRVKHDTLAGQLADDAEAMETAVATARILKEQADEGIEIDELERSELRGELEELEASTRASKQTARDIGLEACAKP
jgi:hypothetical protein